MVALCGVFFAMGYMIGRNTSKGAGTNLDASAQTAAASSSAVPQSENSEPPRETAGVETPQPAADRPSEAPAAAPSSATPTPDATTANPAPPASSTITKAAQDAPVVPEPGAIFLQVTALRRADADNLLKTLREQNFPAVLANSSKPDLFRVMVGPYRQTADVADAKARLKALGFANAFVQK